MDENVASLSGVGTKTAALLAQLGVATVGEMLDYFPFRYEDLRFAVPASALGRAGGEENAVGTILDVKERRVRHLEIVEATLVDDAGGTFVAKWIGQRRFVYGRFASGMRLFVRGRVERKHGVPAVNVAQYATLAPGETYRGELVPVYRASKELASRKIAGVIKRNLPRLLATVNGDPLPAAVARERRYLPVRESYRGVHAPAQPEEAQLARERFVFTEFLALATGAALRRARRERDHGAPALRVPPGLLDEFAGSLPFALTAAQRTAISEIWDDMTRDVPMNRLLQGDVGSGKTLVAAAAIVLASRNGVQSALMAPTEILAAQHTAKLAPLLSSLRIGVEAVFGSQGQRARNSAAARLAGGEAGLAVGTHALLSEGVDFDRLGLAIIDEQHRFGVEHRARLRSKGSAPHTLHMTATPIPRTLAQSVYADLDLSIIDELPPGRTPVDTYAVRASRLHLVYEFVGESVARGGQAYVVAPAIEEGDYDLTSAVAEAQRLSAEVFPGLRLGLLHGRLTPSEKGEVMQRFVRGELDVLVATTVIEVGVDVPNASVMVVLDAHRYGLAQLHQLRGRVGRGAAKSSCILVYPDDVEESARLEILTRSNDGFAIAEEDLRLRGPGEFAGTAQSGGVSELRLADLIADFDVYRAAKAEAERIVAEDPELSADEHAGLRALLERRPSTRSLLYSS
jgi:ATP-dependent DNA helicase RecG